MSSDDRAAGAAASGQPGIRQLVRPHRHADLDARLLAELRRGGRMTPAALGRALGLDRLGVRQRLNQLHRLGLARFAGETDTPRSWGARVRESLWEAVPDTDESGGSRA